MDLQRSVIIHDEAIVCIPELDIQVRSMLGGKITTIEGAISSLYNEIKGLNIIATDSNVEKKQYKNRNKRIQSSSRDA
jgi:C4-type Zn-finger protein